MAKDWQDQYKDLEFLTLEEAAIILAGFDPTEPIDAIQLPITERCWRLLRDAVVTQQVRVLDQQNEGGEYFAVSHSDIRRWCETKGYAWPLAGDDPTQIMAEPTTQKPSPAPKRKRLDNLGRAILDAWRKGLSLDATASDLFDYLVKSDDTGYIRGRDGDELQWENTSGELTRTSLKALANRLPKLRDEFSEDR